jgi:hypothetical protein
MLGIAASPIAWVHYTLFLLPVFFAARMSPPLVAAATLLVVPVAVVLRFLDAPAWQQLTIGSTYNWAIVLGLFALMPTATPDVVGGFADLAAILRRSRRAACRSELSR